MRARNGDLSYRPDIDGLRAVAVVPVVLFHAGFPQFSGGFVGVDVFFVISGFLITGIIAKEIDRDSFSIAEFYRRRARRILPALTAMVLAVLAAGFFVLTPDQYFTVGRASLWIAAFASNFFFWRNTSYFEAGSSFEPLLHTWSLAVEEQFYIFFPILLMLLKRHRMRVTVLVSLGIASFVLSCALVRMAPGAAFYLLPTRAWQLITGGLLVLGMFGPPPNARVAAMLSWIGLALIVVPTVAYEATTPFPGVAAVPPTLGAALLIWSGSEGAGRLLSTRPMVSIGLASYSIYLWHMPIFEFAKYLKGSSLEPATALALSLASVGVGFLSLRFIERPFRGTSQISLQRLAVLASAGIPLVAAPALAVTLMQGVPARLSPEARDAISVADDETRHPIQCLSLDQKWIDPSAPCILGSENAAPTTLLWGDSHAMVTATAMEAAAYAANASFLFAANADCPIGIGFRIDPRTSPSLTSQGHYRRCSEYNIKMLTRASDPAIKTVVLSSRWTNWRMDQPANPSEQDAEIRLLSDVGDGTGNRLIFEAAFRRLVETLRQEGKRVIVVGPLPEPSFNVPERAFLFAKGVAPEPDPIPLSTFRKRHAAALQLFEGLGVEVVRPEQVLCRHGLCPVMRDGRPAFFDHNHLSVATALATAPLYDDIFKDGRNATDGP